MISLFPLGETRRVALISIGGEESLRRNEACYRACVALFEDGRLTPEATLCLVQELAEFCQFHHTGRFADGRLENVALEIGQRLDSLVAQVPLRPDNCEWPEPNLERRHVLHVTTSVETIGGHTRTIQRWIEADPNSRHSLLTTAQTMAVPEPIRQAIANAKGRLTILPRQGALLARAWWLRQAAMSANVVVLHHFGYDVVPIVAFAVPGGPPVGLINHADHLFWLGGSVTDTVIHQRNVSRVLGANRRYYRDEIDLPIPLTDNESGRGNARESLGISKDEIVLVSVGRACKYIPTSEHHFIRTANAILDHDSRLHLYLVGVAQGDQTVLQGMIEHPRLHLVGEVADASRYQKAADVYIEGFPFGSQTALLEAALAGVVPVRAYAPPLDLLVSGDEILDDLVPTPSSEAEYIRLVLSLALETPTRERFSQQLRERAIQCHTGSGWRKRLEKVYETLGKQKHKPQLLPQSDGLSTERDVALAGWQAARSQSEGGMKALVRATLVKAAYRARENGEQGGAMTMLGHCLRQYGWNTRVVKALAKALLLRLSRFS